MTRDGTWEVYDEQLPLLGATYGKAAVRMVALGLRGGGLVVWSPGSRSEAVQADLARWGEPRFLLAPNHFHNAGLAEWKARNPGAQVVAHPRAHARLKKRLPVLGDIGTLDVLNAALPEGVRAFGPPMATQGEMWFGVNRGDLRALVVCDAITNFEHIAWMYQLLGFRARLMTNPFFKRMFLESKAAYKEWMSGELSERSPNLFIPSHGAVIRGEDVAGRLRVATELA